MTTANPTRPLPTPANGTVLANGLNEVGAARWLITTIRAQHWTDANLIHPHCHDHPISGYPNHPAKCVAKRFHKFSLEHLKFGA